MKSIFYLVGASLIACAVPAQAQNQNDSENAKQLSSYPSKSIFNSFKEGCAVTSDKATIASALHQFGWSDFVDAKDERVAGFAQMLQGMRSLAVTTNGGEIAENEVFSRNVAGQDIFLFLSELFVNEKRVTTCWLIDFDEDNEITAAEVEEWLNREPQEKLIEPEFHSATWEPGINENLRKFQVYFIPKGSPAKEQIMFQGVAFKSFYIGAITE